MLYASLFTLLMGFTYAAAMDNSAEDFVKKLTFDGLLPYEIDAKIDKYIPPINVSEKRLSAAEHAEYNLPFRFNPIDSKNNDAHEASAQKDSSPVKRGCTLQYCDLSQNSVNDFLIINKESWQNPINEFFRCIGSFTFHKQDACLVNRDHFPYKSVVLKPDVRVWRRENELCCTYLLLEGYLNVNSYGYPVDSDSDNTVFYTARHNGSIVKHIYVQTNRLFQHVEFQPPLSKETLRMLYETNQVFDGVSAYDANQFALQFDHTQPDILLIRRHPWKTDYTVLHRPTGYIQSIAGDTQESLENNCGKKIGFRTGNLIHYPLLNSKSKNRLRLLGDDVGINLVTIHPVISGFRGLRVMSLVQTAKDLYQQYKQQSLVTPAVAQNLIALFKDLVPIQADRYFFVWQSQQEDATYALKELYKISHSSAHV